MDIGGLIAYISIIVAGYALLSEERRIDIKLRMTWFEYLIMFGVAIVVLYIIYLPVLKDIGLLIPLPWLFGFNEMTTVFTSFLLMTVLLALKLKSNKLPKSKMGRFNVISKNLLAQKQLKPLGYLFERYHDQVIEVLSREPWYVSWHNRLNPGFIFSLTPVPEKVGWLSKLWTSMKRFVSKIFPSSYKYGDIAREGIAKLLKSKQFVKFITSTYPLVAAKFTLRNYDGDGEFRKTYFVELISNHQSALYRELRDNQNCSHTGRYDIDESNAILSHFFNDIRVASSAQLWKPIGEYVIEFIESHKGNEDYYNQMNGRFDQGEERWECPIYVSNIFFEIMVMECLFQRHNDHMWLMYIETYVDKIIGSLDPADDVDLSVEFPTRYHFLLYCCISTLSSWVSSIEYLPKLTQEQSQACHFNERPENFACASFGTAIHDILNSAKFELDKKQYFLDIALRTLKVLEQNNAQAYIDIIVRNIFQRNEYTKMKPEFLPKVAAAFNGSDHMLKGFNISFNKELENRLEPSTA